ncbi:Scr1 family TA system antitoxin-like transcriptional regulator [Streptosporangium sp. LJ11]|uniref:helix-turn-helix domain-containing protein n=1 Tax=Streptosporangium sp. LJ11 TaxID=3436927 RepID=UPI003F792F9A
MVAERLRKLWAGVRGPFVDSDKEGIISNLYTPQAIWGRELRYYRKAAGLTQGQLAERIHFSESLISGVETGQLPASPEFVIATLDGGGDVLYAETTVRGLITSDQEDVTAAVERFEAIRTEALPLSMSIELIQRAVEEKWT